MKNPKQKLETRNSKFETNPNVEFRKRKSGCEVRISDSEFVSRLGLRHSGFVACLIVALLTAAPFFSEAATTFFTDDFAHGSTLNQPPVNPTATSTSYQLMSSKSWSPAPSLAAADLKFGIAATTSGSIEAQALFANSPVALVVEGDYIEITITFTNTAGILTTNQLFGVGLYNSGHAFPVSGGLNGTAVNSQTANTTGGAQNWAGYVAQISFTNGTSRIMTRVAQATGPDNRNQDLVTSGSGSFSYGTPAATTVGSTSTNSLALTAGQVYTEDLIISLSSSNTLYITNRLFSGATATGTPLSLFGAEATGTLLASGFDAFAIGWRETAGGQATALDISSISVTGQSTPVTTPPSIDVQPSPVSVPVGGSAAFKVVASGFGMTYQWHRFGTNLVNGGNISGATSSMLVISPVSADVASGLNGYYVTVSGTGGFTTNSVTNSLSLRSAADLVWAGSDSVWDLANTADWLNGANSSVFNLGDNVTFDDTGIGNLTVNLSNNFLSAASVTVNSSSDYVMSGNGSIAGLGKLDYIGSGHLRINNANTYSGGTLISNVTAYLVLNNYNGLGSGPVRLAGGQMEIIPSGSASVGINGDVIVDDDFSITYDANSAFGAVLLGNLSGTSGKVLTINYNNVNTTQSRFRIYGANTVYDGDLNLTDNRIVWSCYQGSGSQTYNGVISGLGMLIQRGAGTTILNGPSTYSGGTTPTAGVLAFGRDTVGSVDSGPIGTGPLLLAPEAPNLTGAGNVQAFGGARTIANPIQYLSGTNNYTLQVSGSNAMTFSGPVSLNGNDGLGTATNRFFQIANTALTTLSGAISDGGLGYGFVKTGNGTLALMGLETYTGPTLITNGTLQVDGQLDVGAVTVATNATLGGRGTINGPVTVLAGGTLAPGDSIAVTIGLLTINNNLTIGGNLNIELNKSGSTPTSDRTVVSGNLNNTGTGTISVTNRGPALVQGDTFTLFNKPVVNGGSMLVTGANVIWTNKLAVDGTIAVASVVATNPTNITFTVSGNTLTISWPADHLGWRLQAQTNAPGVGIGTNWGIISGTAGVTQYQAPVNPANGSVFYRLISP
jgi:autotransporter-associated beta strand protein